MSKTNNTELASLRQTALGILSSPTTDDVAFVEWLQKFADRGNAILHPPQKPSDAFNRDIRREFSRFQTDQEAINWAHYKKITLPKGQFWWWFNPECRTGRIVGFDIETQVETTKIVDRSFGIPRITNGIDVWIERFDGTIFLGHRDWLIMDRRTKDEDRYDENGNLKPREKKPGKRDKALNEPSAEHIRLATKIVSEKMLGSFAEKYTSVTKKEFPTISILSAEVVAPYVKEWLDTIAVNAI